MSMMFPKPEKPRRGNMACRRYMELAAQLPCTYCGNSPVELHHPISGRFARRRASDLDVIPVCLRCHRLRHDHPAMFERAYGPDTDRIEPTREAVERLRKRTIGGR